MTDASLVLSIDQGTTSTRCILFDRQGTPVASGQKELAQRFPGPGMVEHDAEQIWQDVLETGRRAIAGAGDPALACIGITNQRETTVVWNRRTGKPIANAIVWQDRRTADACARLRDDGQGDLVRARTGLLLDPYFSATKIAWLLDHVDGARPAAEAGELAFGTIDCWLLWNLTGAAVHATDATNASRTMLFDIHRQCWDEDLCRLLRVPMSLLPEVRDSSDDFGIAQTQWFGAEVPITGIAGDQQAATVGQACFAPGMIKSTYGTGCFAVMNTGPDAVRSDNRLLTTVAYRLGGKTTYALEGSIFVAGAAVQWLRDGLGIIGQAAQTAALAASIDGTGGVIMVPAFTGLGAPYWDADARGALLGLTRDTGVAQIARAALEAVCYQTRDLLEAMNGDAGEAITGLRVDGGMVENDWLVQYLADVLAIPVERPVVTETTALGAAYLAALGAGWFDSLDEVARHWRLQARFEPNMAEDIREARYAGWLDAVRRVRTSN